MIMEMEKNGLVFPFNCVLLDDEMSLKRIGFSQSHSLDCSFLSFPTSTISPIVDDEWRSPSTFFGANAVKCILATSQKLTFDPLEG